MVSQCAFSRAEPSGVSPGQNRAAARLPVFCWAWLLQGVTAQALADVAQTLNFVHSAACWMTN